MKPQQFIMLIVALGCGLGAMVMTQKFLNRKDKGDNVEMAPVVVATGNIAPGQVIAESMLRVENYDKEKIPEGAISDPNEVIGKSVRRQMGDREIFVTSAFPKGGGKGIAAILEDGKRALTVPTSSDRAVAGFVKPNDHVDIILNVKQRGVGQYATSKIILQDVRVLAVDTNMNNSEGTPDDQGSIVEMVTFLLTPEESELLTLAQNSGTLSIVLRNPGDTKVVKTKGASLEKILAGQDEEEVVPETPEKFFVDNQKTGQSGGLLGLLTSIVAKQEEQAEQEAEAKVEPEQVVQAEPIPVEPQIQRKWLVYRDLEGNELMRVLVDADSDIAARLKDQLEDVNLGEEAGNAGRTIPAINNNPVAFPGKRS